MKSVKKAGKVSQQPSPEDSESSGDAEILAQKRANLIERVENWRSDRDFGLYGLLDDVVVEIKLLRAERDTARREVCYCHPESVQFAINRGWDCFQEAP